MSARRRANSRGDSARGPEGYLLQPRLVELFWDDHSFFMGENHLEETIVPQISVGYLVRETNEYVKIAQTITDGTPSECLVVDKRMLRRKRVLRESQ